MLKMSTTNLHFEELWEKCENLHQEIGELEDISLLMDELIMKIELYKAISTKDGVADEERMKAKSRALGEILLSLTRVSLKDNINVFEALGVALQYRSINYYNQKYQTT